MNKAEIALFKEYHRMAQQNPDMQLYYYSESDRMWMSVNNEWILTEDGMMSEYVQNDVSVTIFETGEEAIETHIVKHYYSFSLISAFKLVRMVPSIESTADRLNKLL